MRPIKLTMSAFGSYSGMETIDFTKIQGGLFLVTGDTGAGKTTIFDAVTYALYDRTSGGRRDGNMMRSQYADDEAETFVEYTFAYRDGQYTIRRNPEYMRAGKRKNADGKIRLVKETSKVSLIMPDGKEFQGKKREVDQKIEQIIGLDAGQFTQIAMIAQGDFLRLLHAESKERKKIFSKIFQTQIYRDVQEQLKEQGKALYIQLKENEADIRREMERVDADGSKVQKVWGDLISQEMPSAEAVTETLGRILKEGKDLTIIAIGKMVAKAIEVSNELEKDGIEAEIINARFLKPLDEKNILKSIQKTQKIITIEDGSINGGLYTSIAELVVGLKNIDLRGFAYDDKFVQHGTVEEIENENKLNVKNIVEEIKNAER